MIEFEPFEYRREFHELGLTVTMSTWPDSRLIVGAVYGYICEKGKHWTLLIEEDHAGNRADGFAGIPWYDKGFHGRILEDKSPMQIWSDQAIARCQLLHKPLTQTTEGELV